MNREELEALTLEEVRGHADTLGIEYHHKAGKSKLIEAILIADSQIEEDAAEVEEAETAVDETPSDPEAEEIAPAPTATQDFKPDAPLPQAPGYPSKEEILKALDSHIKRGLQVVELSNDYWHFRVKNKEASGNVKMPLGQFVIQANLLLMPTNAPTEDLDIEEIMALRIGSRR